MFSAVVEHMVELQELRPRFSTTAALAAVCDQHQLPQTSVFSSQPHSLFTAAGFAMFCPIRLPRISARRAQTSFSAGAIDVSTLLPADAASSATIIVCRLPALRALMCDSTRVLILASGGFATFAVGSVVGSVIAPLAQSCRFS